MSEKTTGIVCAFLITFLLGMMLGLIIIKLRDTKFCPECGHHYESKIEYCPIDGTELKEIVKK